MQWDYLHKWPTPTLERLKAHPLRRHVEGSPLHGLAGCVNELGIHHF